MSENTRSLWIQQALPEEVWKPVPNYEGVYDVSNMGRVRGLLTRKGKKAGRILTNHQIPQGYCYVKLCHNSHQKRFYVHRLVLAAFAPVDGYEDLDVNHRDGIRNNNRVDNLEWMSHADNIRYSMHVLKTFGTFGGKKGTPPSNAKMTPEMVKEIRAMAAAGMHYKEIAKIYPMTPGGIHHIISRKTWKHVE